MPHRARNHSNPSAACSRRILNGRETIFSVGAELRSETIERQAEEGRAGRQGNAELCFLNRPAAEGQYLFPEPPEAGTLLRFLAHCGVLFSGITSFFRH